MSIREKARELAMQTLYQYALRGSDGFDVRGSFGWLDADSPRIQDLAAEWAEGAIADLDAIDALIDVHLRNWSGDRVGAVERSILRLAAHELRSSPDLAVEIIIDEAVKLAKRYCEGDSFKFINGVLDAIAATLARTV
ncbi:MAG: transcription antitermination factor NusB [Spirochaetota bacterium]|jgi:N utilization substance protein B|nr:transcription antitermination factor NusB [Spirochaetota bacterium]